MQIEEKEETSVEGNQEGARRETPFCLIRSKPHYDLRARPSKPSISINTDREYHYPDRGGGRFWIRKEHRDIMLIARYYNMDRPRCSFLQGVLFSDFSPTYRVSAYRCMRISSGQQSTLWWKKKKIKKIINKRKKRHRPFGSSISLPSLREGRKDLSEIIQNIFSTLR